MKEGYKLKAEKCERQEGKDKKQKAGKKGRNLMAGIKKRHPAGRKYKVRVTGRKVKAYS